MNPFRSPGNIPRLILSLTLLPLNGGVMAALRSPQDEAARITYREAYDAGFADGFKLGAEDRTRNRSFDLANKKLFQDAHRGFDDARHDSEVYPVAYRRGFEDGYSKGYGLEASGDSLPPPQPIDPPAPRRAFLRTSTDLPSQGNVIPSGTEFLIELLDTLSTKFSERGDPFGARLIQEVRIGQGLVIPEGTQVQGRIAYLRRAGRIRGRAQINLRFERLRLLNGQEALIDAYVVDIEPTSVEKVEGDEGAIVAPGDKSGDAKSVGTAAGVGSLIGVISGGKKGAGVGAAAGAVAGLANVLMTRGRDAQLESRTRMTIRLINEAQLERSDPNSDARPVPKP